jgi:hypothetical protein
MGRVQESHMFWVLEVKGAWPPSSSSSPNSLAGPPLSGIMFQGVLALTLFTTVLIFVLVFHSSLIDQVKKGEAEVRLTVHSNDPDLLIFPEV